jgi:septum formation protein
MQAAAVESEQANAMMLLNKPISTHNVTPDTASISHGDRFRRPLAGVGRRPLVLLASRSPRRIELLTQAGVDFVVAQPMLNDADLDSGAATAERWVAAMAYLKAATAVRQRLHMAEEGRKIGVVLGADTVVAHGEEIIGQPRDEADARRIIDQLADATHDVLTGVAMLCPSTNRREIFIDRATVRVGALNPQSVDEYIASGQWRGKAGAYNLAERIGAGWPISFDGDPGTIMGLPVQMVVDRLEAWN